MASFEIEDTYMTWLRNNVIARFSGEKIQASESAVKFIALAMQMQIAESAIENDEVLFKRTQILVERMSDDIGAAIPEFFKDWFGHRN